MLIGAATAAMLSAVVLTGCGDPTDTLEGTLWEVETMISSEIAYMP